MLREEFNNNRKKEYDKIYSSLFINKSLVNKKGMIGFDKSEPEISASRPAPSSPLE